MKEGYEFIGRAYSDEEKEQATGMIDTWTKEARKPVEGELEKTEEEVKMIELINELINKEYESLGLEGGSPIEPDQIHILPGEVYQKYEDDKESKAFARSIEKAVFLNKGQLDSLPHELSTLLHESIHFRSTHKFYASEEKDIYDARVGYRLRSPWKETDQDKFRGFNELMTDYTTYKILKENVDVLKEKLGITQEDIQGPIYGHYMRYVPILNAICAKVAEHRGQTPREVFTDFERGQFSNTILALKDIDTVFGKGSMRILSYLQSTNDLDDNEHLLGMIQRYFETGDSAERDRVGEEIKAFVEEEQMTRPNIER